VYKNISDDFVENLEEFLKEKSDEGIEYTIELV
jgi:hypothetical protein